MTQQSEARCCPVGCAQDRGNAVTMAIVKCQGLFQGVIFQSSGTLGEYGNNWNLNDLQLWLQQKKISQDIRARRAEQAG